MAEISTVQLWWDSVVTEVEQAAADVAGAAAEVAYFTGTADIGAVGVVAVVGGAIAIPELVLAAFALIIAFAVGTLLLGPLGDLLGHVPLVGGPLKAILHGAQSAIWSAVQTIAKGAFDGLVHFFVWIWSMTFGAIVAAAAAINGLIYLAHWTASVQVPNAIGTAFHYTEYLVGNLTVYAQSLYNQSITYAANAAAGAIAEAQRLAQFGITYSQQLFNRAISFAQTAVADLRIYVDAGLAQVTGYATTEFQRAEEFTLERFHQVEVDLSAFRSEVGTAIAGAVQTTEGFATTAIGAATGVITGELNAVETQLQTEVQAVGQRLATWEETCLRDECAANAPNARNVLNLLGKLQTGAMLAFLIAAIEDPVDTANVTADILTPVTDPAFGLATTIFGAAA